jgi:hypothetical protein
MATAVAFACPVCGGQEIVEYAGRPNARCSSCDALERHRRIARVYESLFPDGGGGRRAMEVGPLSRDVFGAFLRRRGWDYTAIDQSERGNPVDERDVSFADLIIDLVALDGIETDSVHLFFAQHVIEEIVEHEQALREIARVLAPGGMALLEIPFDWSRRQSESQPPAAYGNVWKFGADLPIAVRAALPQTDILDYVEGNFRGHLFICTAT